MCIYVSQLARYITIAVFVGIAVLLAFDLNVVIYTPAITEFVFFRRWRNLGLRLILRCTTYSPANTVLRIEKNNKQGRSIKQDVRGCSVNRKMYENIS